MGFDEWTLVAILVGLAGFAGWLLGHECRVSDADERERKAFRVGFRVGRARHE